MGTESTTPREKKRRRKRARPSRADRFAQEWAPTIHVELLVAWGAADDGPMPTREDAERIAQERTALLVDGLGEWAETSPKLLDANQKSARRRRGWRRNAWPKKRRNDGDDGPWWSYWYDD